MSYTQDLTQINTVYCNGVLVSELRRALSQLDKLLDCGELNAQNTENAEALYCRLYVKMRLTEYFRDFDENISGELSVFISENMAGAASKGYKKTCAVLNGIKSVLEYFASVSTKLSSYARAVDGAYSSATYKSVLNSLERLKTEVENAEIRQPFGDGVAFADVKRVLCDRVDGAIERTEKAAFAELEKRAGHNLKPVPETYRLYEYYPLPEYDEGGKANTVIMCTPFAEEGILYAVRASGEETVFVLDALELGAQTEEDIDDIFSVAVKRAGALIVFHAEKLASVKKTALYKSAMLAGKRGLKIFIHDENGDGAEYDACLKIADGREDMSAVDISANFITMPSFSDVCAELEVKGIISGAAEYGEIKAMPFMGFIGLNKVVSQFIAGADWKKAGRKISAERVSAAEKYLSGLKSSYLFIDSGWGDFSCGGTAVAENTDGFDYDGVRDIDQENVRRIIESGHNAFAKCGMIARYCTLAGGDKSDWERIGREEMLERLTVATRLVFKLMRVETVPEVELLDRLDNPGAGGLCCDGGKRILYKYGVVKNDWQWTIGCILHESFHAMQAKLRKGGWSQWYYDNFGITRGRVERWAFTNNIYDGNVNSDLYKVHIIEADAKAFEINCDAARNAAWNTIEFV